MSKENPRATTHIRSVRLSLQGAIEGEGDRLCWHLRVRKVRLTGLVHEDGVQEAVNEESVRLGEPFRLGAPTEVHLKRFDAIVAEARKLLGGQ